MERSFDVKDLEARFEEVRKSEYFPAIIGAVAGGLTGALMAGLIAGARRGSSDVRVERGDGANSGVVLGFSIKELVQLATVVAGLARQLRDWRDRSA